MASNTRFLTVPKSALIREALKALIEHESARRLAHLGRSEPDLKAARRRRSPTA